MNWGWGWTGDCGCCEDGPCDLVGLVTDNFASVNPRWQSSTFVGTETAQIDTAKPGMEMSVPAGSGFRRAFLYRCHELPGTLVGSTFRYKAKILVDATFPSPASLFAGYQHGIRFLNTTGITGDPFSGASLFLTASTSTGTYFAGGGGSFAVDTMVSYSLGDVVEVSIYFDSLVSGNTYNVDSEWVVNSSTIRSESTAWDLGVAPTLFHTIGSVGVPNSSSSIYETWTQDHESQAIPP